MIKALILVAASCLAAPASASVQFFFTDGGTNPWAGAGPAGGPLDPTGDRQLDYTQDGYVPNYAAFPPAFVPHATAGVGDTVYFWVKFNGEINGQRIHGIDLVLDGTPGEVAYYVCDDTASGGNRRWDGVYTPPDDPEFKNWPRQILPGVTALGIKNTSANWPANLYAGGARRTALLGAVEYDQPGTYTPHLGPLGIAYSGHPPPAVEFCSLTVTPEPATVALVALGGSLLRRRGRAWTARGSGAFGDRRY